jgi:aerobic carbon-monoxide dehydrogenase medium subunit
MSSFEYSQPADVQAAALAVSANADAKFLGGGQSLLAAIKLRLASPSELVDVTRIAALNGIRVDSNKLMIGAAMRHAQVADSPDVQRLIPALAELAGGIGDRQVRAMGTLGGSLANDDPAACYPAAVLALNATIVTHKRAIGAEDFFVGMYETALAPDELITQVEFPVPQQAAYAKFANPASRFALVGVFVAKFGPTVRVAVTGAGPSVFRVKALEDALAADFSVRAARGVTIDADGLNDDLHGSAAYRAHLIPVLAGRAVERALTRRAIA